MKTYKEEFEDDVIGERREIGETREVLESGIDGERKEGWWDSTSLTHSIPFSSSCSFLFFFFFSAVFKVFKRKKKKNKENELEWWSVLWRKKRSKLNAPELQS